MPIYDLVMIKERQFNPFLAVALLVAVVAAFPLLSEPGLLNTRGGGDSPFLLQRLHQLETAVLQGHFPVRWMPDANYGYGYPFYNYYAPLSIYITLVFRLLGFSFVRAIQLSQLAAFFVAAWGMYALAKRWFNNEWAGLLTAVAYTIAPFHLVNVYVRGDSLAEFWAMAFYPLVILAADNLVTSNERRKKHIALFGLAYAALILSHNISAMIFSPFLLLFILLRWISHTRSSKANRQSIIVNLKSLSFAFLLAFALSAWFFVPALAETGLAQLGTVTEGYFHFSTHFLGTDSLGLVQDSFFFDYGVNGRNAFRMGLIQAIIAIAATLLLLIQRHKAEKSYPNFAMLSPVHPFTRSPVPPFIFLTILIATLMMTPLTSWLWEHLPLLSFTQFPWRFLSVQAFGIALAVGSIAILPGRRWIVPLVATLLIVTSVGKLQTDHLILSDADVTAVKIAQYEWFTGNIGTTVSAEYLPINVIPRPYSSQWVNSGERDKVVVMAGDVTAVSLINRRATQQTWQIETSTPATIRFNTLFWPGWGAKINGEATAIRPSPGSGLITLDLPAGTHIVALRLGRTPVRLIAELVSLTAVFILAWLIKPAERQRVSRSLGVGIVAVIAIAVTVRLWPSNIPEANTLSWDFAEMGYLHATPDGIPFDNELLLKSYTLSATEVKAGESIEIMLNWQGVAPEAAIALTTPAANWPDIKPAPPVLVSETMQGNTAVYTLTIPETAPTGLVVPRVVVKNGRAYTPSGKPRGTLFLQPIRIINIDNPVEFDVESLTVSAVSVVQVEPQLLQVQLAWQAERPLDRNLNVSLRLTDANGEFLRLIDRQPGYGFLPSATWLIQQMVYDWHNIPVPPLSEGHQLPFVLVAQLYDVQDPTQTLLTRRLGELTRQNNIYTFQQTEPQFDLPDGMEPVTAVFGNAIQLLGYTLNETAESVELSLVWQAIENGHVDYTRFIHLIDAANPGAPIVNNDSMPRHGSYPTSQWSVGEIIVEQVSLSVTEVPKAEYQIAVGFYTQNGDEFIRLTAVDTNNDPLPENRFILPFSIEK